MKRRGGEGRGEQKRDVEKMGGETRQGEAGRNTDVSFKTKLFLKLDNSNIFFQ